MFRTAGLGYSGTFVRVAWGVQMANLKVLLDRAFQHPWMTGIGTVVTVIALATAWFFPNGSTNDSTSIGGGVGDCAAVGEGASSDCATTIYHPPATRSIGDVYFEWGGFATFLYAGESENLPTPPDYPPAEVRGHCDEWEDWLSETVGIYSMAPAVGISLTSGQDEQVVINEVEATVFNKDPLPDDGDYTIIQCQYGAGYNAGLYIVIDVGTNTTTLVDYESPSPMTMPPASVILNGHDYQRVTVSVESSTGYLYAGRIRVNFLVNGKKRSVDLGSAERPFRWVGGRPPETPFENRWDWHPKRGQWVEGLRPADVYP